MPAKRGLGDEIGVCSLRHSLYTLRLIFIANAFMKGVYEINCLVPGGFLKNTCVAA